MSSSYRLHNPLTHPPGSQLKRKFPNHQTDAITSSKKRVRMMQKGCWSGLPLHHDSLPSKPPPLITPSVNTIATPTKLPPSEECSISVLMHPTACGASRCWKSESKVKRDARRRKVQIGDPSRKAEEMKSNGGINATCFRVSTTGWQGTNYGLSKQRSVLRKEWYDYSILFRLTEFERVPYQR